MDSTAKHKRDANAIIRGILSEQRSNVRRHRGKGHTADHLVAFYVSVSFPDRRETKFLSSCFSILP